MRHIVDGLFPTHLARTGAMNDTKSLAAVIFTAEEFAIAAKKLPGPNRIPGEIIRLMINLRPQIFLDLYNTYLTTLAIDGRRRGWSLFLRARAIPVCCQFIGR